MDKMRMAVIGCGRPRGTPGSTGGAQGHKHIVAYHWLADDIELVAACDIRQDNLDLFCDYHRIPNRFTDYRQMLEQMELDAVDVSVWPGLHAEMVIAAAEAGAKWVHCEKPMATTFGDAKAMVKTCNDHGALLTINHQYRYSGAFPVAKRLLDAGKIGELARVETFTRNLFDMGTHYFDLMLWYNNQQPVEWVMGQIDAREARAVFGAQVEGQGLSYFRWKNGVYGMMMTGHGCEDRCQHRLLGTEGEIEIGSKDGPPVRYRNLQTHYQWQEVPPDPRPSLPDDFWWYPEFDQGHRNHSLADAALIIPVVEAIKEGRTPMCSGDNALQATELIFATYESSRRRARVDLPLESEDNAFAAMLEEGALQTWAQA